MDSAANTALLLGIDIGSTTVKAVLVDPAVEQVVWHRYLRHEAEQRAVTERMLRELAEYCPWRPVQPIFTGSGSRDIAELCGFPHVQEVVANSLAVRTFFPQARVAIELGGQDAKTIFFRHDPETGQLVASDMRMNGSCAGGTGAFIDEVASLLQIPVERFNEYAAGGTQVYQISGRCGVFAKTDLQPLLNQGVSREDLALSTFHALARQTVGGLAQGLEIVPPVVFQGGPLTFNPRLVDVFAERLGLEESQALSPAKPELFVAHGAALAVPVIFPETEAITTLELAEQFMTMNREGRSLGAGAHEEPTDAQARFEAMPFFVDGADRDEFFQRHRRAEMRRRECPAGSTQAVYIGIDAGSTTTKIALIDENDELLDSAYSANKGEPLYVAAELLHDLLARYEAEGVTLEIRGVGTTGYGEKLFAGGFSADYHTVETVAHARAALRSEPNAGFILDVGGQDMKAIRVVDGVVTGITLNEACSAGCGSFLESFAGTLGIPVDQIASRAFASATPSRLGSRCTVFMNSSIITEQKNGKTPEDIMAGLCRSIVENIFTKVVRVANFGMLGDRVVVQGGTFENDAVLRSLEQYIERPVVRALHPGLMGAIGIAMLTREHQAAVGAERSAFAGLASLENFGFERRTGWVCELCSNACSRTVVRFTGGAQFVSGNRCERGAATAPEAAAARRDRSARSRVKNMMGERERLLLEGTDRASSDKRENAGGRVGSEGRRIGIPRALEFWQSVPFWRSFWNTLGYEVVLSGASSWELYERGIASVPSDTVCFPAKLAHGHLHDLIDRGVDRIFMPIVNRTPPENPNTQSDHVCAVLKGYPIVLEVSDEPEQRFGVPLDRPLFHWINEKVRRKQIVDWMTREFAVEAREVAAAVDGAAEAQRGFEEELRRRGRELIAELEGTDRFAVVLAGRPYHTDRIVNHDLANYFVDAGIPVLTVDSLPDLDHVDLSSTRAELTINYHVRMFAAALRVAEHPNLELVQIVSFGCGHDAIVTDEITRLMESRSGKTPLVLKLDETEVKGPLQLRVRSFIETVTARRASSVSADGAAAAAYGAPPARIADDSQDPFPVKYHKRDRQTRVIMAPNVTRAFSQVISAAIGADGYRIVPVPMADRRAIELGKRYVHNDMCFPAQVNVGEMLRALETGFVRPDEAVCGLAKVQCDCRLAHYATVARKALDEAGYEQVPIITTDDDTKNMHPGFSLSPLFQLRMVWALAIIDALEDLRRQIRPYEVTPGRVDAVFERGIERISEAIGRSIKRALSALEEVVGELCEVSLTEEPQRPKVFIIGEFLLNFHSTSNFRIERYLEANGMQAVLPNILDSFRRLFMKARTERKQFFIRHSFIETALNGVSELLIDYALNKVEAIAARHPRYTPRARLPEIAKHSEDLVHHTFTAGEGWMIAGDILHYAAQGVKSFLILQPFGCLPNHVTGRGIIKKLKQLHPDVQILSLDYDPDTSFANIENRLQMLILNNKLAEIDAASDAAREPAPDSLVQAPKTGGHSTTRSA